MRPLPFTHEPLIRWPADFLSLKCRGEFVLFGMAGLVVALGLLGVVR